MSKFLKFITNEFVILSITFIYFTSILGTISNYFPLLILLILLLKSKSILSYFDSTLIWIIIFSILYTSISFAHGINDNSKGKYIFYLIYLPIFYILGKYLISKWCTQSYFLLFYLLFILSFNTLIDISIDISQHGFINTSRSISSASWSKDLSATLRGAHLSLCLGSFSILFVRANTRKQRIFKYIFMFFGILGVLGVSHLINRTGLVLVALSSIAILILNFKALTFKYYLIIIILSVIVLYIVSPIISNSNLLDAYEYRNEKGYDISSLGGRSERWLNGIQSIIDSPMGGGEFKLGRRDYAHNLWLDVSEIAGILPFFALILATFLQIKKTFKILKNKLLSSFLISILVIFNLSFFITCAVEPILEGSYIYLCGFILFWGYTSAYNKTSSYKYNCYE